MVMTVLAGLCAGGLTALSLSAVAAPSPGAAVAPPPAMIDEKTADKAAVNPAGNPNSRPPEVNPIQGDPDLEPQVTLIERDDGTHEEVRVNGVIRYIKVTPRIGPVYYLVPVNGVSGAYVQRDSLDSGLRVPMWQIFSW
jgi:hypothetical protein